MHLVKLASGDVEAHKAAVEQIKKEAGRLDVVIANAGQHLFFFNVAIVRLDANRLFVQGISDTWATMLNTTPDEMRTHYDVRSCRIPGKTPLHR